MPEPVQLPEDWGPRLIIGGLGGLTLVIVRAIQLRFYIDEPGTTVLVGWLTLLGLAIISMIGAFLSDDHTRLKIYVTALGAPALVMAFLSGSLQFSAPAQTSSVGDPSDIQQLSLFLPALYAQERSTGGTDETSPQGNLSIREFDFRDARNGSAADGFTASITGQLPPDRNQYLYVIGRTADAATARTTARRLIDDMGQAFKEGIPPPDIHLLKAVGDDDIFVVIGSFLPTALAAETLRSNVMSVLLGSEIEPDTKNLVREGIVIDAWALAGVR